MSTKPRLRLRRRWRTTLRWRQTTRRWATTPGWIFKMFLISLHTTNFCHLHLNSWGKNAIKILCKFKLCWRRMPGRGGPRRWRERRERRWCPSRQRWRWPRRTLCKSHKCVPLIGSAVLSNENGTNNGQKMGKRELSNIPFSHFQPSLSGVIRIGLPSIKM